jgi:dual specificity MAP kinase phosphatase
LTDVDDLESFELNHPELVAVDSCGRTTDYKIEFLVQEREEMRKLTTATKISENVYLGHSSDVFTPFIEYPSPDKEVVSKGYDICIECKDMAEIASAATLKDAETFLTGAADGGRQWSLRTLTRPLSLEFPTGSPPLTSRHHPDTIVSFCEWMYHMTHSQGEDTLMSDDSNPSTDRTILIHCQDGYTESSFLAIAYLMYAEGLPAHEAWVKLHKTLNRSFFTFETDLQTLKSLQFAILVRSPAVNALKELSSPSVIPDWFTHSSFDGSFPSRILSHMYLGNLQHANNPEMLRTLGITKVLSIGEEVTWDKEKEKAAGMELLYVDNVQDNGIDPLLDAIDPCLEFLGTYFLRCVNIDAAYRVGQKALVHCRVGVSRSASICIAEVIRRTHLSLPRAYLYVRARRLNVIIQPNLRFMYELMKWEELEFARRNNDIEMGCHKSQYKREMEWAWLCKEIADLNKTYTSTT